MHAGDDDELCVQVRQVMVMMLMLIMCRPSCQRGPAAHHVCRQHHRPSHHRQLQQVTESLSSIDMAFCVSCHSHSVSHEVLTAAQIVLLMQGFINI